MRLIIAKLTKGEHARLMSDDLLRAMRHRVVSLLCISTIGGTVQDRFTLLKRCVFCRIFRDGFDLIFREALRLRLSGGSSGSL